MGDQASIMEVEKMLEKGFSEQEVIDHFLTHGKTMIEKQREKSEKLQALLKDSNMTPEETIEMLKTTLDDADKAQIERMLAQGCSIEEIVSHFSNRGLNASTQESQLASQVKKLSHGKALNVDQMLSLIEQQLSEDGKNELAEMLKKGYSKQDVINHFMNNGKTAQEEQIETANKLSVLINTDTMSDDEMVAILREQLSPSDKQIMEDMLHEGKHVKDIVNHFIERIDINPAESEIAIEIEKMLAQGVPLEKVIQHFMSHGKTTEEEEVAVAEKLKNLMNSSLSEEELKQILSSELNEKDKNKMDEMLKQGFSMDEVLE